MWRVAAITGTVTDDVGEAVSGARVQALRRTFVAGRSRLVRAGAFAESDDLGGYRFGALVPGDYLIVTTTYTISASATAVGLVDAVRRTGGSASTDFMREAQVKGAASPLLDLYNGFGMQRLGDVLIAFGGAASAPTPADPAAIAHYSTVWHPAGAGPAQATVVTVASGDERSGIDLHLRLTTSVRVSGVVAGPDGPVANLGLRLVPAGLDEVADETAFTPCLTASAADGSFTFLGVDPGQYTIRAVTLPRLRPSSMAGGATAAEAMLWVATPVTVGDAGVTGVRAVARIGARVSGRIAYDGSAAPLSAAELRMLGVLFDVADGRVVAPAMAYVALVDASGTFTIGLIGGRYLIRIPDAVREWTFKSAVAGGRDVSDAPLEVAANDVDNLVLTLTDHPAVLAGTVRTAQGNPDADAIVLVFPVDPLTWIDTGRTQRRLRSARPSRSGAFTMTGLPPGDYNAVAVNAAAIGEWQDPAVLQALARVASRVRVDDGQRASVALATTVVR
jgi:hypothetical protein